MKNNKNTSTLKRIEGGLAIDDRGQLRFVNDFDFQGVKRFYQVENHQIGVIRAFHGHLKEAKYVYVAKGSIILCAVPFSDKKNPDKKTVVERHILSAKKPGIIYIPAGYANGFKALEEDTAVIFFSTADMKETQGDDYRFSHDYWGNEIWEVENR